MAEKPDFLNRKETARYLAQRGIQVAPQTLADWASEGRGPPYYRLDNGNALYRPDEVDEWVTKNLRRIER